MELFILIQTVVYHFFHYDAAMIQLFLKVLCRNEQVSAGLIWGHLYWVLVCLCLGYNLFDSKGLSFLHDCKQDLLCFVSFKLFYDCDGLRLVFWQGVSKGSVLISVKFIGGIFILKIPYLFDAVEFTGQDAKYAAHRVSLTVEILIAMCHVRLLRRGVVEHAKDVLQLAFGNVPEQLWLLDLTDFRVDFTPLIVSENSLEVVFGEDGRNKIFGDNNAGGVSGLYCNQWVLSETISAAKHGHLLHHRNFTDDAVLVSFFANCLISEFLHERQQPLLLSSELVPVQRWVHIISLYVLLGHSEKELVEFFHINEVQRSEQTCT